MMGWHLASIFHLAFMSFLPYPLFLQDFYFWYLWSIKDDEIVVRTGVALILAGAIWKFN